MLLSQLGNQPFGGGGIGAVTSVDGQTGVVDLSGNYPPLDNTVLKTGAQTIAGEKIFIDKFEIITGETTSSKFHFGEQAAQGAWFTSSIPNQLVMSGGAEIVSDAWRARATAASIINLANGAISFLSKSGLTPGSTFTPSLRLLIAADGKVSIGNILASDEELHVDGNVKAIDIILTCSDTSFPDGTKAVTQSPDDNSLKLATTEYADAAGGGGDVVGPPSSFNNAIPRFDLATGKLLKSSGTSLNDSGDLSTPGRLISQNTSAISIQSLFGGASVSKDITAGQNITAVAGNITATAGNITAGQNITAGGNIKQKVYTNAVSNPPTSSELTAILGSPASVGAGFSARINNGGTGVNYYMAESDGVNWWIFAGTKAL